MSSVVSAAGGSALHPRVILRDGEHGGWLRFEAPRRLLIARELDEVLPRLRELAAAVEGEGLHAAGFISYEAAPAFDSALSVRADGAFPLLWFGLFGPPRRHEALPDADGAPPPAPAWSASITPEAYRAGFDAIREYIRNGHTYQVNFTYRLNAALAADPWRVFAQLMADHQTPCAAFVDTGEWALCSASPELFFRLEGDRIESRPMKGTAARGLWPADDGRKAAELRASEKERAENVMIVDMVRNDLGRIAEAGTVEVPHLFSIERYPTVWQMTSTVRARTRAPLDRIFQALFPAASITGAPKRRAMEIIAEIETTPRRAYTGTIGYAAPGRQARFNVAIRTLLVDHAGARAEYGVGGGIVWDSECAREQQECAVKARVLHVRRPDFDLIETLRWSPADGYPLLRRHLERLARSAEYFGFGVDLSHVERELARFASGLPAGAHRVRLLVTRRGAARCEAVALGPAADAFADIAVASAPIDRDDVFLYHKTTRRGVYEDAVRSRPGFADVLLHNDAGEITESTIANVAVESGGILYTPPVRCGLLPGVQRARLLESGAIRERVIRLEEVLSGPDVYLMNAVRGMRKVRVVSRGR